MTPQDMAAIHRACFPHRAWSAEEIEVLANQAGAHVLASEDHRGFLIARAVLDEAELLTIAVAPAARRAGIARALLMRLSQQLQRSGVTELFLEVGANNHPALALYKGLGFAVTGTRPGYYKSSEGVAEDALLMRAALPLGQAGQSMTTPPKSG